MKETNNSNESGERPQKEVKLNFNPELHDQKIDRRMSEEAMSKCRAIISRAYAEWKKRLETKIKRALLSPNDPTKQLTQQDIIRMVYDLHEVVAREANTPEMFEWRSFTMEILEDLVGTIILTQLKKNLFTEFVPEQKATNALVIPQRHPFETYEEFEAIPFIQKFREKEGFVGFLREQKQVMALFDDGEVVMAGIVASPKGVEKLPTRYQMMKGLERSDQ